MKITPSMYPDARSFVKDWEKVTRGEEASPPILTLDGIDAAFSNGVYKGGDYDHILSYVPNVSLMRRHRSDFIRRGILDKRTLDKLRHYSPITESDIESDIEPVTVSFSTGSPATYRVPFSNPGGPQKYPIIRVMYKLLRDRAEVIRCEHKIWLQTMLRAAYSGVHTPVSRVLSYDQEVGQASVEMLLSLYI